MKWTETRSESLLAAHHGRDQIQDMTIAAKKDGTLTGLDVHLSPTWAPTSASSGRACRSSARSCSTRSTRSRRCKFTCTNVFTTKTLTDAYRGAGRPEATFAIERMMDELAVELGRDPMELREQNWIKHEEFPFTTVVGLTYDSGNYEQATAAGHVHVRLRGPAPRAGGAARERRPGPARHRHLDVHRDVRARPVARCSARWPTARAAGRPRRIRMLATGKVEVVTGASAHGQGHETAFSQIVADQLGVPFEDVEILHGDTQVSPKGLDTYGSRSLVVGGIAIVKAAQKVIAKAKKLAAHLLEASEDDLEFADGRFAVKGTDKGMAIQEVVVRRVHGAQLPGGHGAQPRLRRRVRPGELLLPARHAPRARSRSTPRPGTSTCASTSAWTTSAT